MKKLRGVIGGALATLMVMCLSLPVEAAAKTSVLPGDWGSKDGIMKMLQFVASLIMYGLGGVAIIGTTIAGILYLTARDNEQQVAKAKMRLFEIAIGLLAWAVLFTVLNWLVPGGIKIDF